MKKFCAAMAALCVAMAVPAQSRNPDPASPAPATYEEFTRAIRLNDLAALRKLSAPHGAVLVRNSLRAQPLHYAALYGSLEAVRILLDAGADPGAHNQQEATPLLYAAWNASKTRLLVEHGAPVNDAARDGTTPLFIAASAQGNADVVQYLLDHGANPNATDLFGDDALIRAAGMSDPKTLQLLLQRGADPHRADRAGFTALQQAQDFPDRARVDLLLKAGADVNSFNTLALMVRNGPLALRHITPLIAAAAYADEDKLQALLKGGARVNDVDVRKLGALTMAVATDRARPANVKLLIAAGADVNAIDLNGESVLDWAYKFANPEIVSVLEHAGAHGRAPSAIHLTPGSQATGSADALTRTLPLLARTGTQFFKEGGGCNGCHHQPMGARVYGAAGDSGVPLAEDVRLPFGAAVLAERPSYLTGLPLLRALPGDVDRLLSPLLALADLHAPASDFTDVALHYLAARQDSSGAWLGIASRPPIQDGPISRTAMAIRALRTYAWPARRPEFEERIERARHWLLNAHPLTTYEEADRITGLRAAGTSTADLRPLAETLLRLQRADGGWGQTPYLPSDAYATGLSLHCLYAAGLLMPDTPAYQRGVAFLLRTQFPDGSWYVRSRAPRFQPYFQSGFPFEHDQWISSTGTAWAAIALLHAENHSAAVKPSPAF